MAKYQFHTKPMTKNILSKVQGTIFITDGDIHGPLEIDWKESGLKMLVSSTISKTRTIVSITDNYYLLSSCLDYYHTKVTYLAFTSQGRILGYQEKISQPVFFGTTKYDPIPTRLDLHKKYGLSSAGRKVLITYPSQKYFSTHPKLKTFLKRLLFYLVDLELQPIFRMLPNESVPESDRLPQGRYYSPADYVYPSLDLQLLQITSLCLAFDWYSSLWEDSIVTHTPIIDLATDKLSFPDRSAIVGAGDWDKLNLDTFQKLVYKALSCSSEIFDGLVTKFLSTPGETSSRLLDFISGDESSSSVVACSDRAQHEQCLDRIRKDIGPGDNNTVAKTMGLPTKKQLTTETLLNTSPAINGEENIVDPVLKTGVWRKATSGNPETVNPIENTIDMVYVVHFSHEGNPHKESGELRFSLQNQGCPTTYLAAREIDSYRVSYQGDPTNQEVAEPEIGSLDFNSDSLYLLVNYLDALLDAERRQYQKVMLLTDIHQVSQYFTQLYQKNWKNMYPVPYLVMDYSARNLDTRELQYVFYQMDHRLDLDRIGAMIIHGSTYITQLYKYLKHRHYPLHHSLNRFLHQIPTHNCAILSRSVFYHQDDLEEFDHNESLWKKLLEADSDSGDRPLFSATTSETPPATSPSAEILGPIREVAEDNNEESSPPDNSHAGEDLKICSPIFQNTKFVSYLRKEMYFVWRQYQRYQGFPKELETNRAYYFSISEWFTSMEPPYHSCDDSEDLGQTIHNMTRLAQMDSLPEKLSQVQLIVSLSSKDDPELVTCFLLHCLLYGVPILVNPTELVQSILGPNYPYYYRSPAEASRKMENHNLLRISHNYLKSRVK